MMLFTNFTHYLQRNLPDFIESALDSRHREPSRHMILLSYVAMGPQRTPLAVGGDTNPLGWRQAPPSTCLGRDKDMHWSQDGIFLSCPIAIAIASPRHASAIVNSKHYVCVSFHH